MHKIVEDFKNKSSLIVDFLKKEIAPIRSNRPNPGIVENIKVNCYDRVLTIKEVGSITVQLPREISIHVWDKSILENVFKAVEAANVGSAAIQGEVVRVFLPELSEERRKELVKQIKQIAEKNRIQLRHERDEANKLIEKSFKGGEIKEDLKFKLKEEIQRITEKTNEEIEKILELKVKEINE